MSNILASREGRVGLAHINRPEARNALNAETMIELLAALEAFDADDGIGAMVVTGSEKVFAAGADIKAMASIGMVDMMSSPMINQWARLRALRKPLIAAVNGWCLGGGNELAMSCDMIVAGESARFGQPEINIGVIPGAGGTQRLTRAVGKAIAMEMVLNGRFLTPQEALQFGLINRVVPVEQCLPEAVKLAAEIAARAPFAVRLGKEAVNAAFETALQDGIFLERRLFSMLFATEDQKEGMSAFIEKRPPQWKGK